MGSWIYDLGWSALLALRQGPKEALGARKTPGGKGGMWWGDGWEMVGMMVGMWLEG